MAGLIFVVALGIAMALLTVKLLNSEWFTGIDPDKRPRKRKGKWEWKRDASADCIGGHVGQPMWDRQFGDWIKICSHCRMKYI
jgi:hypothetical protein